MKVSIGNYPKHPEKKARTIKVQIDRWDWYNVDHTLALIISPMLKQFKESNASYPGCLTSDQWNEILDKIIWSMDQIVEDDIHLSSGKEYIDKVQEGCELLGKWFQNLWS